MPANSAQSTPTVAHNEKTRSEAGPTAALLANVVATVKPTDSKTTAQIGKPKPPLRATVAAPSTRKPTSISPTLRRDARFLLARTQPLCLLVVIGVREDGEKELLAVEDDYRESED